MFVSFCSRGGIDRRFVRFGVCALCVGFSSTCIIISIAVSSI